MGRVGLHGKVQAFSHYAEAVPVLEWLLDQVENALNGGIDSTNLAASAVGTTQIADGSVTAAKTADGVGQVTSLTFVGDGTTANRVIALPFTPRYVLVLRTDATFLTFESIAVSGTTWFWLRDSTGAESASTANWQGIVTNGAKLGTSAVGTSNAAGVTYALTAYK